MEKRSIKMLLIAVATLFLFSCTGEMGVKDNAYLGKMPSYAKKFSHQLSVIREEGEAFMKKYDDTDYKWKEDNEMTREYSRMEEEYKAFLKNSEQQIKDYLKTNPLVGTQIPFEQTGDQEIIEVSGIKISQASQKSNLRRDEFGFIKLELDCKVKNSNLRYFYYKYLDSKGKIISADRRDVYKIKKNYIIYIYTNLLDSMEDFAKVVIIDKAEFEAILENPSL